jgi:hypothetical protein
MPATSNAHTRTPQMHATAAGRPAPHPVHRVCSYGTRCCQRTPTYTHTHTRTHARTHTHCGDARAVLRAGIRTWRFCLCRLFFAPPFPPPLQRVCGTRLLCRADGRRVRRMSHGASRSHSHRPALSLWVCGRPSGCGGKHVRCWRGGYSPSHRGTHMSKCALAAAGGYRSSALRHAAAGSVS